MQSERNATSPLTAVCVGPAIGCASKETSLHDNNRSVRYNCSICLDSVTAPVLTPCGHLYCWPCLYLWLAPGLTAIENDRSGLPNEEPMTDDGLDVHRRCPMCKSSCIIGELTPIYINEEAPLYDKSTHETDALVDSEKEQCGFEQRTVVIPRRPVARCLKREREIVDDASGSHALSFERNEAIRANASLSKGLFPLFQLFSHQDIANEADTVQQASSTPESDKMVRNIIIFLLCSKVMVLVSLPVH